ncbi:SDR family oxidoreductase [Rubricoccus marinus]|uniref:Short chain dehydrogenase n=1 Tax=Rubricoccus marinus TaxID=716817 RepID=A0A259U318_9BACT|nr:NAD(P)-dependent oxidoreductase [Rubricoccus marinus]OZC04425.1 short chain dehydrogenase [Rubricoccus marinus]
MSDAPLAGKTIFITGGSRGIGEAIAVRAAQDGANVAVAAKTSEPHPKLPGTIHTAVEKIEEAGGKGLAIQMDARDDERVAEAIAQTAEHFGGIDIVINNASAIFLASTEATPMKRYDLMMSVNVRATFAVTQAALPHLKESAKAGRGPHILTLSPPLDMDPKWFASHLPYTMSKFGMSMCVLGWAREFKEIGIGANALWPKTTIATAAVKNLLGGQDMIEASRTPDIVANAAHWILSQDPRGTTGHFFLDEEVLRMAGETQFDQYAVTPGAELMPDLFL